MIEKFQLIRISTGILLLAIVTEENERALIGFQDDKEYRIFHILYLQFAFKLNSKN